MKKFLNPKSQWHQNRFPITDQFSEVIEFLKNHGFKHLEFDRVKYGATAQLVSEAKKVDYPLFMYGQTDQSRPRVYWIRFCNPGKISNVNPIFFCEAIRNGKTFDPLNYFVEDDRWTELERFDNIDDFAHYADNYFDWRKIY